jgi:glycosyltransferase involved in cell wall biosynthesis
VAPPVADPAGRPGAHHTLILVTGFSGQPTCAQLERQAAAGERPRKDYVELARRLDAEVVDEPYMRERATPLARAIARRAGLPAGQIAEAFLRGGRYDHICAWAERIGIPLALLHKLTLVDRDLVLIASWLSSGLKATMLRDLRVHTRLRAIVSYGSSQLDIAATRLGVPRDKLHLALSPVDERFWRPGPSASNNRICAVGSSGRDYETLFAALRGLDLELRVAVGSGELPARLLERRLDGAGPPPNAQFRHYKPLELRELYGSSRFVVVPLEDVDYDAGVTALTEAMAMGKAVIATRTRGQIDLIEDGQQGIYVRPGEPRELRAAIERLVADPAEADRMGRAGRALVEARHTLDEYATRVAAIIRGPAQPG